MLHVVIIDDEIYTVNKILEYILDYKEAIKVVGVFDSVNSGLLGLKKLKPDILFLDVRIQDKTGFELLSILKEYDFDVVFITALEQYAIQAFKFNAVDYLLKPLNKKEFIDTIKRILSRKSSNGHIERFEALLCDISNNLCPKKVQIPTRSGFILLDSLNILRCESDGNYTKIFSNSNGVILASKTIKWFELLLGPCNFCRIHNSHLININYIQKYTQGKGGYVTMKDGAQLSVSIRRKDAFFKRLNKE